MCVDVRFENISLQSIANYTGAQLYSSTHEEFAMCVNICVCFQKSAQNEGVDNQKNKTSMTVCSNLCGAAGAAVTTGVLSL